MSASDVIRAATERGATIAVAESLTGGALASALVDVPGASRVVRLGVVAYATPMKHQVLGVDAFLLDARGAVDPDVVQQMAAGVRRLAAIGDSPCDIGVATTGVAGPDGQDGHEPGECWVGVATARGTRAVAVSALGDRAAVRRAVVEEALRALEEALGESIA